MRLLNKRLSRLQLKVILSIARHIELDYNFVAHITHAAARAHIREHAETHTHTHACTRMQADND